MLLSALTGNQRIDYEIANNPNLSESGKSFLRSLKRVRAIGTRKAFFLFDVLNGRLNEVQSPRTTLGMPKQELYP